MCFTIMFNVDGAVFAVGRRSVRLSRRAIHVIVVCGTTRYVICRPCSFEYHLSELQDLSWEPEIKPAPLLVVVVPALPRGAAVELHVTAAQDDPAKRTSCHVTAKAACGSIECHTITSADGCSASLSLSLSAPSDDLEVTRAKDVTEAVAAAFKNAMKKMDAELVPLCARVFYKCDHSLAQEVVKGTSLDMYLTQDTTHEL